MEARAIAQDNPFYKSREAFEKMVHKLSSNEVQLYDHAQVERLVEESGREVLRRLMQDHLDARGDGSASEAVEGDDGVERTHRRVRSRPLRTLFGLVTLTRQCYGARGRHSRAPADAHLNMPSGTYSLGVRRRVAAEAGKVSFDAVVSSLAATTGAPVPKRQAEELAQRAATDFEAFYEQRKPASTTSSSGVLVLTTDAKGVVMRTQDLREATRKAAEKSRPKLDKRRTKGEKAGRKRMAQVAAVYTVEPFFRTTDDVVGELRTCKVDDEPTAKKRPKPERKRVWASITQSPEEVILQAFDEAALRDPTREKDWVALVDGNETQLEAIMACVPSSKTTVTVIVDLIHVLEYLWMAGHAIHGEGKPQTQEWVTKRLRYLLDGVDAHTVAAGIRRSATKLDVDGSRRKRVETCARYLCKYADHLRYADYLAAGYPIATGVIEGACRHLVKDRMDITGARWSLEGAEAVLRLRALQASGDFDAYWEFHERRELERNHLSRYANRHLPELAAAANSGPTPHLRLAS